jgi:hypothetical protein
MHTNTHTNPHLEAQYNAAKELVLSLSTYDGSQAFANAYRIFKELQTMRRLQTSQ